jgi:Polysaccharide lyase
VHVIRLSRFLIPATVLMMASVTAGVALAAPAPSGLIWEGLASKGTSVFGNLQEAPGTITVANDPTGKYGPSFRYETYTNPKGGKSRCESSGTRGFTFNSSQYGKTFYVGWRAYWDVNITPGAWTSFWQFHWGGASGLGGGPMTIRTLGNGQLSLQLVTAAGAPNQDIWNARMPNRKWNRFVVAFHYEPNNTGWVEFWYNGVRQKFVNGSTIEHGLMQRGTFDELKWGVYRSGANHGPGTDPGVEYVNDPRLGTTYASVAPAA